MKRLITDGFLVIDKSKGMTSHDVVAIGRRALHTRRVGHAGTLDPMATGVLVLGYGVGTRLLQYITEGDKSYLATIVLGARTVSDDAEGELLASASKEELDSISEDAIHEALSRMRGRIQQRPSSVSAIKVNGERAYAKVRAGEEFELPSREVTISELQILEIRREGKIEIDISVTCSAGTYIRAIARDCGDTLGVGGYLNALRRTRVGPFTLEQAISVEVLKSGEFQPIPLGDVARRTFAVRQVSAEEMAEISYGRALDLNPTNEITVAFHGEQLLALLKNRDGLAKPIAVFAAKS